MSSVSFSRGNKLCHQHQRQRLWRFVLLQCHWGQQGWRGRTGDSWPQTFSSNTNAPPGTGAEAPTTYSSWPCLLLPPPLVSGTSPAVPRVRQDLVPASAGLGCFEGEKASLERAGGDAALSSRPLQALCKQGPRASCCLCQLHKHGWGCRGCGCSKGCVTAGDNTGGATHKPGQHLAVPPPPFAGFWISSTANTGHVPWALAQLHRRLAQLQCHDARQLSGSLCPLDPHRQQGWTVTPSPR